MDETYRMAQPVVYIVNEWEKDDLDDILEKIKNKCNPHQIENDLVCIGSCCFPNMDSASSLIAYLIDVYRKHGGLKVKRTTILSREDELLGLQLCLADINLQVTGEYDSPISDVLTEIDYISARKLENPTQENNPKLNESKIKNKNDEERQNIFDKYQQFLKNSSYIDFYDLFNFYKDQCFSKKEDVQYLNNKSFILFDLPQISIEKAMFSFLCSTREITHILVQSSSLECKEINLEFHSVAKCSDILESAQFAQTPRMKQSKLSHTEKFIQQIFLSYIDLLVNSSSSISLARVINIPDRKIDHYAFTVLKRRANQSNLSMYQLIISLVMNIRLGGKGYAPDQNDPLLMYVKGLSELVNFLQSLHTKIEDEPDPRLACDCVVRFIKKAILKSKESLSQKPAVKEMAEKIQQEIKDVYQEFEAKHQDNTSQSCIQHGSKTLKILQAVFDRHTIESTASRDTSVLSEVFLTQGTPIRFPSLLSMFRSPEPSETLEKVPPLKERLFKNINKTNRAHPSCLSWVPASVKDHIPIIDVQYVLPSKTLVCPASGKKSCIDFSITGKENLLPSDTTNALSIPDDTGSKDDGKSIKENKCKGNELKRKRISTKSNSSSKKKCCKKLLPLIKGQTTLDFFVGKNSCSGVP